MKKGIWLGLMIVLVLLTGLSDKGWANLSYTGEVIESEQLQGFVIPEMSLSPSGRYGIIIPKRSMDGDGPYNVPAENNYNAVVEMNSFKIIKKFNVGHAVPDSVGSYCDVSLKWNKAETAVIFCVYGKWSHREIELISFEHEGKTKEIDILKKIQLEILRRTKEAAPKKYAECKESNKGNGVAYPEGFVVDADVDFTEGQFPLNFKADLIANIKQLPGKPNLESKMTGIIDQNGTLKIMSFKITRDDYTEDNSND